MSSLSSAAAASYYRPPIGRQPNDGRSKKGYQQPEQAKANYIHYANTPDRTTVPTVPTHPAQSLPHSTDPASASESPPTTAPGLIPFTSVQQSPQQSIRMGSILDDVNSTMDALGVTPNIHDRVHKYMATIADQATHPNPSKRHIHESLKVIGGILDGFITDALKQPSSVVREWVDALLLQPIQYEDPSLQHQITKDRSSSEKVSQPTQPPQASPEQHQQWREQIKASKSALKYGRADEAASQLLQLVGDLETHGETALLANTLTGLAKAYKHTGQTSAADTALQSAAQLYLQLGESHKAILQWRNLAQLYIEHSQPQKAHQAFEQGSTLSNQLVQQTASKGAFTPLLKQAATLHNDWASHLYGQGDLPAAKTQFKMARQLALQPNGPKGLLPDIYSNLAHVFMGQGDSDKAERALLQSMKAAQKLGDTNSYQDSWNHLQQIYAQDAANA